MIEIRLHGRGGQGAVTAAELIAHAAFFEGKYSQAFPFFGVERRGAPVEAFARISDQPIRLRSQIYLPDVVIIQDPSLIGTVDLVKGLKKNGIIIINAEKNEDFSHALDFPAKQIFSAPVTALALEILGRPVVNTGLLAIFAQATGLIKFESLVKAVRQQFADKAELIEKNIKLMERIQR
jgi:2-oxoacid:acceptor oxidoreductase gamma subunit (pyruvate/2-ketoisovalerate family)